MKSYREDFYFFLDLLCTKTPFAFSKYFDREYAILIGCTLTNCDGWHFDAQEDKHLQNALLESLQFAEDGYYIGIMCYCCVPNAFIDGVKWMRGIVNVDKNHLTWATIFVNSNYQLYKKEFIPEYKNHNIVLIAHKDSKVDNLPFQIEEFIPIELESWKDLNLIEKIASRTDSDKLYLFCAGPLGNLAIAKLWHRNKYNIYFDIGATLNPWLLGHNNSRDYHQYEKHNICRW